MEKVIEEVENAYFVDYDTPEVKQMCAAVQRCLDDFRTAFNDHQSSALQIETLFPCGSMAEQTTIWLDKHNYQHWKTEKKILNGSMVRLPSDYRSIEFDNLAVLAPLTDDMKTSATCTGHARITSESVEDTLTIKDFRKRSRPDSCNTRVKDIHDLTSVDKSDHNMTTSSVENNDKGITTHEATTMCLSNASISQKADEYVAPDETNDICTDTDSGSEESEAYIFRQSYHTIIYEFYETVRLVAQTNHTFQHEMELGKCVLEFTDSDKVPVLFVWTSSDASCTNRVIAGKIDFIPAFRTTHLPFDTFIVGKRCVPTGNCRQCYTSDHCEHNCKQQCWRISQSYEEIRLIRTTEKHHRDLYRFIKVICDKISKHHVYSESMYEDDEVADRIELPKSYHIKTALIQHIKSCKNGGSDISLCFSQMLHTLKESVDVGHIQNWKGTFSIGLEFYEIHVYSIIWIVFSQLSNDSGALSQPDVDNLKSYEFPTTLEHKAINLMTDIASRKLSSDAILKSLTDILVHLLWEYALNVIQLNDELVSNGHCDILLEPRAKLYGSAAGLVTDEESSENDEMNLKRCHSETDLKVLEEYLEEKNFDKNWEKLFQQMKVNAYFDCSFTKQIKDDKLKKQVYSTRELMLPYDFTEKENIIAYIKEDEDFWLDRFWESFVHSQYVN